MPEFQKVTVVGLGYIGLPTAALIASRGFQVVGVDTKEYVVKTVASGAIHIAEPDLDGLVSKVVSSGALTTSNKPQAADVFIIAVPTPIDGSNRPDLSNVNAAVESILDLLVPGNLIILESTSPIGTTEGIAKRIGERRPDLRIGINGSEDGAVYVAYCPERVLPGRILSELINNDRCIGGITPACTRRAQRFYKLFVRGACVATTARAAELVKLTENAFRDVNIAFANELSLICDRFDINVWEVIDIANRHPRVNVLRPGPGVGGHCIAVDPWFIIDSAPDLARVMRTSREVNNAKTENIIKRAEALIDDHPYASVACCGLAFKANVDDLRESPAMEIAIHLAKKYGQRIKVVEPNLRRLPPELADFQVGFVNIDEALRSCEIAILLVDHDEFKMVPLAERRHLDVIDTRGIWQDMPVRT
ncbi:MULTISPECIES: UDP-N-acetyl-D-mannosamine dehydrogenase [unclassified Bradyrhizobium]|jgi:UDP-N-acetyl-D-mannosaminuronic acid dehydrogenase|uniref:UDP-N-acetyl-D-mannosamine dehydrogenase n=1 Tax=unclassified Bradyrhizobium TaxID=2631580 RepID=UPI001FFBD722|nr:MULTISPECIES: UDP-N-acetyl-D-mannosamine dehydrogenase [unclassified Bradyrhizobium]MCK1518899.1 UDP-N-acetyl-D-mannosamine dehydrogenase [Bradyrhizobium sp. 17]MCK1689699.1 UDP-N-acetyl-D-mannosamine dehydrogenase [Bradyrhizobium sp. 145]